MKRHYSFLDFVFDAIFVVLTGGWYLWYKLLENLLKAVFKGHKN